MEGRKLKFEFLWNGRNSVTYSHLTNLTLQFIKQPGPLIQLIFWGDKIQFQGDVDFKCPYFLLHRNKTLKGKFEICLPIQRTWTWKIMTERNEDADGGI